MIGHFVHTFGDAHIYLDHVDGAREQLARQPLPPPSIALSDRPLLEQRFDDVELVGYESHPAIRLKVSV